MIATACNADIVWWNLNAPVADAAANALSSDPVLSFIRLKIPAVSDADFPVNASRPRNARMFGNACAIAATFPWNAVFSVSSVASSPFCFSSSRSPPADRPTSFRPFAVFGAFFNNVVNVAVRFVAEVAASIPMRV